MSCCLDKLVNNLLDDAFKYNNQVFKNTKRFSLMKKM